MKTYFSFSLKGKDWWKPFILYWVLYIILNSPSQRASKESDFAFLHPGFYSGINVVFSLGLFILQVIFTIVFLRIIMPKLSIGGKAFSFRGDIGSFLKINVLGLLLTIITVTIYAPWYARRVTAYLMGETAFNEESPEFLGVAKKLLKYFLLVFWIPVIILSFIFGMAVYNSTGGEILNSFTSSKSAVIWWSGLAVPVFLIVLIPFCYLVYKWYVNIKWKEVRISWDTSLWPSCRYILGQLLLTIITIGIYWPAATLKLFRYFADKTVFSRQDGVFGRLQFEGDIRKGFGLLWGQALLCLITLGIYTPWAVQKAGGWVASLTCYEETGLTV